MRVKLLKINGFKRFHQLYLTALPKEARLVVMTGPNGCGKSSVFDAFATWYGYHRDWGQFDQAYHTKAGLPVAPWNQCTHVEFFEPMPTAPDQRKKLFYIRSAYRNEPEFMMNSFAKSGSALDDSRAVRRLIDNDVHVSDNYQRLVSSTIAALYDGSSDESTVKALRETLIGDIRDSMSRVFDDLLLTGPGNPFEQGTFFFDKGKSKDFRYQNLSGGEKAAFDLLLDLIVKRVTYNDTVFCIDEPELHMHTRLQARLLEEIYRLLPPPCQLWISTHSIGMMRKARELHENNPAEVVFLDFHELDFDKNTQLTPTVPNRAFWRKALTVALDDLADLVAPKQVVLCEGRKPSPGNPARGEFDASCYRIIFAQDFADTDFLSVGNAAEVQSDRLEAGGAIQTLVSGTTVIRVIDRDDRSPQEISQLEKEGVKVLSRRHLEAYLMDDEILTALCAKVEKPDRAAEVLAAKVQAMKDSIARGNPSDDVKSAAGIIYNESKRILALTGCGNYVEAFCRDTLAPLVVPSTETYRLLKHGIFGT
jgi:predicted ATPase